jgi:Tol biopolymer transport system component
VTEGKGGSWNSEGVILFSQGAQGSLARISATGGTATQVTQVASHAIALFSPVFLPDGRRFVYGAAGDTVAGTYLGSLDGTVSIRLVAATGNIAYLPSGWLLIWENLQQALIAQRLDVDKAELVGAPVTLAEGVDGAVSASSTGLVAYWRGENGKRQLQWRDRTGSLLDSIGQADETYSSPRVSPDGHRVAVVRGEKDDIWVLEGERSSRVTFDAGNSFPVWSPDGRQIVFRSLRDKAPGIYQKSADGTGEERLVQKFNGVIAPASWSADGRNLTYVFIEPDSKMNIGIQPMTADQKSWIFLNSLAIEGAPEFSPDGRWVAYQSNETMRRQVYVRPFITPEDAGATSSAHSGKWQVSIAGGAYPKWSANGRELFFLDPIGAMMAATISYSGSALAPGTPVKLFSTRVQGGGVGDGGPQYDVARDGRFLINTVLETTASEPSPIILIQNWNPDAGK